MKAWKTNNGYRIIRVLSGRSNVFLLQNGTTNLLVDTSVSRHWKKLCHQLDELKVTSIDALILTHTHYDHAANAQRIKEIYKSLVIVHQKEASYISAGTNPMVNGTNLITRQIIKHMAIPLSARINYEPCKPDIRVDNVYDLQSFGFNAQILYTPGHSIGSMSIVVDDEIALVGDTMFGIFKNSVFPPYALEPKQLIESWSKLLETNCKVFIPSHGSEKGRNIVLADYTAGRKHHFTPADM